MVLYHYTDMNIVEAKLVRHKSEDGLVEVWEDIPIGKIYKIDLDTLRKATFYNEKFKKMHDKYIVNCADNENYGRYLFMDCLEVKDLS